MPFLPNGRGAASRAERVALAVILASFAWMFAAALPARAALVGTITGTVTEGKSHAPLAHVHVTAVSPSGRATALTDARGFFSLTGLQPDTYTISFELQGYESASIPGVTVNAEQIQTVTQVLDRSLKEIGRVSARSSGSAYQPNQTTDTYTVTAAQIDTMQGKENANNEVTLVGSLPGAEVDSSGYPSLRGGRENEIGFEYEGINYTEPYSNQFANSLLLNGVGSLQLSPGAGDASQGNSGTGVINLLAKRGTYPGFGQVSIEGASETYWHDFIGEYGFATANGRFSNYFKYIGQRQAELYGNGNQNLIDIGEYDGNKFNVVNDYVDNMVYKLGKDQSKSFQMFYQGQVVQYQVGAAVNFGQTFYRTGDQAANERLAQIFNFTGADFSPSQVGALRALYPGQTTQNQALDRLPAYNQPLQAMKLQYNDNPDASSYFNLRYYRLSAVTTFDFPVTIPAPAGTNDYQILQGGLRTGGSFDYNRQLNARNLLSLGARYDFDLPVFSDQESRRGLYSVQGLGEIFPGGFFSSGQGYEIMDFLPAGPRCPGNTIGVPCGYLSQYFGGNLPRVPTSTLDEPYTRQEFGVYAKDDIQFSSRFKASLGLRMDGSNLQFGNLQQAFGIPNGTDDEIHPKIFEPRIGTSWQLTRSDAITASFGRSMQNPYFSSMVNTINPAFFAPFANIPAYDDLTGDKGTAVKFCGIHANLPCTSYANQLFWEYQNSVGLPVFTVQPEQFSNYDFSISHQFPNNIAIKLTPFYRNGQNINVTTNPVSFHNGVPTIGPSETTNDGVTKTTGLEFLLTKDAPTGLSGTLAMTYINEFSNVPPLQSEEDAFPSITPASLALGKLYRVGFLSPLEGQLSLSYKTKTGFRFNPVISYVRGYPYNQGFLTAYQLPNGQFATVPNTNLTSPNGPNQSPCFVDPGNPGTYVNPRYVACRGPAESSDPGGLITPARFNTDLTFEYTPPRSHDTFHREVTFGVQILGLFNNLYGYPTYNDCYQPVATGVSGPLSGYGSCVNSNYPYGNGYNGYTNIRGTQPYLLIPNNNYSFTAQTSQAPRLTLFYMQVKL
jgi:hypothetical protein